VEFAENVLSSRRGTLLIGAGAALLAAIVLIVYLKHYRSSVNSSNGTVSVLVAKNLIQKGAPGNIVATNRQFQATEIRRNELKAAAITDPGVLRGLIAAHDIYPGQQLTTADFVAVAPGALQTQLTGDQRAIAVPIDAAHGLAGQIGDGDRVDIYLGMNVNGSGGAVPALKLLIENALILRTPTTGAPAGTVVIRGTGRQTAALAFAADNGKLWFVLRPPSGAKPGRPGLVTAGRLLLGTRPVR
jgi:Flp pilus assembly protein CpaB